MNLGQCREERPSSVTPAPARTNQTATDDSIALAPTTPNRTASATLQLVAAGTVCPAGSAPFSQVEPRGSVPTRVVRTGGGVTRSALLLNHRHGPKRAARMLRPIE